MSRNVLPSDAPTRYDLQLAVVPMAFAIGALAVLLSSIQPHVAGAASATLSSVALLDGTVRRPPGDGE